MKPQSKKESTLAALLDAGLDGIRGLEVATPYQGYEFNHFPGKFWSSCLNSDVAALGKEGITIARCHAPYTNQDGHKSNFKRYWLQDRNAAQRTLNLLNHCRRKRGEEPLPDDLAKLLVDQFPEAKPAPKAS